MNIWEIDKQMESLIDAETGELLDYEAFEALQMERDAKVENMACWVVNLTAEAKAIREQEKTLAERRGSLENKADRLKKYLDTALQGSPFSTDKVAVSYRKTSKVEVDPDFIAWAKANAPELLSYKEPEPSKTEIKEYLKNHDLQYARMIDGKSMTIK